MILLQGEIAGGYALIGLVLIGVLVLVLTLIVFSFLAKDNEGKKGKFTLLIFLLLMLTVATLFGNWLCNIKID